MHLKNQTIVIIGGSSGIGYATAKAALEEGAKVMIVSRNFDKLKQAKDHLNQAVETHICDIRDERELQTLFAKIGPFDHLQLPGSEIQFGAFAALSIDDAKAMFDSKFWGRLIVQLKQLYLI